MFLEPILEEPEDEYVDLFNPSDGEGALPRPAVWRSLSGPSRFRFDNDAAAERRRDHVITLKNKPKKKAQKNTKARKKETEESKQELRLHKSCWTLKTPAKTEDQPVCFQIRMLTWP